nr:unnamed protein product [Digitaria exilis]
MSIRMKEERRNRQSDASITDYDETVGDLNMVPDELQVIPAGVEEEGSLIHFVDAIQKERPVRFSSEQLHAFTRNYAHRVGSGGFGVVYKGSFPDGTPVAVKLLRSELMSRHAKEQFTAEVGTIGRTYHVNLVRLYGFCLDATVKALVYEYMDHGSLDRYIFNPPPEKTKVQFDVLHEIALGTAKALRYLHEECAQRIIHYDIKPQNILLGADLVPKVADFGLARLCNREDTHLTITGARGTPGYAAPELWMPQPVTHKCDVYSYGMLLFEAGDMDAVLARAISPSLCVNSWVGREKAERMCKYRPEDRPSMGSVVRMLEGEDQIAAPRNPLWHRSSTPSPVSNMARGASEPEVDVERPGGEAEHQHAADGDRRVVEVGRSHGVRHIDGPNPNRDTHGPWADPNRAC